MRKSALITCSLLLVPSLFGGGGGEARYVQRTMQKMAVSTAENPATVRMLFYGQSIVEQGWRENLVRMLRKRYPTVNFQARNLAIGGFTSEILIRTAESDLYPEYADIVFFHDYGSTALVRTMIERLRARTTSEIVMWTSHVNRTDASKQTLEELKREDDARSRDLAKIAADNHCMFVNLRRKWCEELQAKGWAADRLLQTDGVHLNAKSEAFDLYARCIAEDMVRVEGVGPDEMSGTITEIAAGSLNGREFVTNANGSVDFAFDGNRVELSFLSYCGFSGSPFDVLLDGRPLSQHPELYRHKRASNLISWMPMLLHQGAKALPLAETWRLTFIEGTSPDGQPICYRVDGSRTGFDGEGRSDRDFVSKSGRVTIKASDFHLWQYKHFAKGNPANAAKPGQWITWETVGDFQETFGYYKPLDKSFVVLSGCTNGPHTLTFVPSIPERRPCIAKLVVHKPFGKDVGETPEEARAATHRAPVNPDWKLNGP